MYFRLVLCPAFPALRREHKLLTFALRLVKKQTCAASRGTLANMAQPGFRTDRPDGWSNYMAQEPNHSDSPRAKDFQDFQAHDSLHHALKSMPTESDTEYHEHVKPNSTEGGTRESSNMQSTRAFLGLHPTAPVAEEHDAEEYSNLMWYKVRMALREPFAEFFGIFGFLLSRQLELTCHRRRLHYGAVW